MPYQPMNFADIRPQPGLDIVSSLIEGYKAGQLPGQMRRDAEGEKFKQALMQAQTAEAQRKANAPPARFPEFEGLPADVVNFEYGQKLKKENPELYKEYERYQSSKNKNSGFGSAALRTKADAMEGLSKLNPSWDNNKLDEGFSRILAGFDTLEDGTPIKSNATIETQANQFGKYATTTQIINQNAQGSQAENELPVISDYITKNIAPYGNTLPGGLNLELAWDTNLKRDDPTTQKKIGRFIAAQALQYEYSQIQQRLASGKAWQGATDELLKRLGSKIEGAYGSYSSTARTEALKEVGKVLGEAFKKRIQAPTSITGIKKKANQAAEDEEFDLDWSL